MENANEAPLMFGAKIRNVVKWAFYSDFSNTLPFDALIELLQFFA